MKTLKGYLLLTRPINLVIAFISIFIGGFVTGSIQPFDKLLLACLSGMFIMAGANTINDYYDTEIDRINKPKRPIPSGMVASANARKAALIFFNTGVIIGLFINPAAFFVALITAILLFLYSYKIKGIVLWSNVTVAFVLGLAFVYGGLAVGLATRAFTVGLFAFLFNFAREIIKDIEDEAGDKAQGIKTLPIRFGIQKTLWFASTALIVLIGFSVVPYFTGLFSALYLTVVILGVDMFLIYVLVSMWKNHSPKNMGRLSFLMKMNMLVCLFAIYLG